MVPEIKKILFISELSKSSRGAFYYAASIASFYKATIDIMHAMEDVQGSMKTHVYTFLGEEMWDKFANKREESARSALIGKKDDSIMVKKALEVVTEDSEDKFQQEQSLVDQIIIKDKQEDIANEIYSQFQKVQYDMVVASYKCFVSFTEMRAGSRIKKVIKNTNIPLLLVPTHKEEWEDEE